MWEEKVKRTNKSHFDKMSCPTAPCKGVSCIICSRLRKWGYLEALKWIDDMMNENLRLPNLPMYHKTGTNVHEAIIKEIEDATL